MKKKQVVWQPHVEPGLLLNPFVPPERRYKPTQMDLSHAHLGEIKVRNVTPRARRDVEKVTE